MILRNCNKLQLFKLNSANNVLVNYLKTFKTFYLSIRLGRKSIYSILCSIKLKKDVLINIKLKHTI